jgi:hypothetical protein
MQVQVTFELNRPPGHRRLLQSSFCTTGHEKGWRGNTNIIGSSSMHRAEQVLLSHVLYNTSFTLSLRNLFEGDSRKFLKWTWNDNAEHWFFYYNTKHCLIWVLFQNSISIQWWLIFWKHILSTWTKKVLNISYICIPCREVPRVICHDLHASLCKQTTLNIESSLFSNFAISCSFLIRRSKPSCSSWPCLRHICSGGPPGLTNCNPTYRKIKCVVSI